MARQSKFKAKSVYTNQWIYGNIVHTTHFTYILSTSFIPAKTLVSESFIEVNPITVCEFVNHFDIDNKEIYENDIYREEIGSDNGDDERIYFICVYIKELARFAWLTLEERFEYENTDNIKDFLDTEIGMSFHYSQKIKVIGNTIDNYKLIQDA